MLAVRLSIMALLSPSLPLGRVLELNLDLELDLDSDLDLDLELNLDELELELELELGLLLTGLDLMDFLALDFGGDLNLFRTCSWTLIKGASN